jgi:hypothetical protein
MLTRAIGMLICAVGLWAEGSPWWLLAAFAIDASNGRLVYPDELHHVPVPHVPTSKSGAPDDSTSGT